MVKSVNADGMSLQPPPAIQPLLDPLIDITRADGYVMAYSRLYDDIYFSSENGYEETMAVFIEPTGLMERFHHARLTTIAELGFGTGLNFCVVLSLFRKHAPADARLHYIATEHAPLGADHIHDVLMAYPHLHKELSDLISILPPRWTGRHRVFLEQGRITLDLVYQDSRDMLAGSDFAADIWFLDGFTPSRNPAMWQDDIFYHMARCSAREAKCASFTAAGAVRRGLEKAGFDITRHDGFGRKRHRITGILSARVSGRRQTTLPSKVNIIGAGIAGASLAHALARRHIDVEVLDVASDPAQGASGNLAALQTPRLTVDPTDHGWLSLNAFGFARRSALAMGAGLDQGCLTLAKDEKESIRQQKLRHLPWPDSVFTHMDAVAVSDQLGVNMTAEGLYYPYAGAVDPRIWIKGLLKDITCLCNVHITSISASEAPITLGDDKGQNHQADIVVLAAGTGLSALWEGRLEPMLPITANCGQVSHIPASQEGISQGGDITTPISFGGYLARAGDGRYALGASYQRMENAHITGQIDQISLKTHTDNYARLPKALQNRIPYVPHEWQGRQSVRATTPDRQPIAGAIGKSLYVLGGLGSRGMVTAPLLAEALAADICGEASPLDFAMRRAVDPYRFSRRAGL